VNPHHHSPVTAPGVELRRYGAVVSSDLHDFHQIVLGFDGAMQMTVEGVGACIDYHSAWLVPAGARHDYAGISENRQLVLDLPAASLAVPERLFDAPRAVRIDRWLRGHLAQPLRIADLAAYCGLGMRRFHALFVDAFGETPHRYLQRLRLDTALTLLAVPRRSLTDIALEVGFGDQSAFTHAFTQRSGIAPGQWRALPPH